MYIYIYIYNYIYTQFCSFYTHVGHCIWWSIAHKLSSIVISACYRLICRYLCLLGGQLRETMETYRRDKLRLCCQEVMGYKLNQIDHLLVLFLKTFYMSRGLRYSYHVLYDMCMCFANTFKQRHPSSVLQPRLMWRIGKTTPRHR